MFNKLRSLIGGGAHPAATAPAIPAGQRVYAIGDVHGRADLMRLMIDRIEADDAARSPAQTTVILLGDLVDRGPDSAGVIALARDWGTRRQVRYLMGNHEEMFLQARSNPEVLRHFLRYGGRATLLSYPIAREEYDRASLEQVQALMHARVPAADYAFMEAMEALIEIGDYVFVHAGIRPGVPLDQQAVSDLRWIRSEFLDSEEPRGFAVVHGHTITPEPEILVRRIGIDTGAFASGRLTAIALEGTARHLIEVIGEPVTDPAY
jgi:serine/threonine protein phosphatase 1